MPVVDLVVIARFHHGRSVRHGRQAFRRGYGEAFQAAIVDMADDCGNRGNHHLSVAGDGVDDARSRAFVRDVRDLDAGAQREQFRRQVGDAAVAGAGVVQL